MNGCGCNYWKELIKSAWGLATTSVRAAKTKDGTRYPDGDGLIDLSDISGGEGTVKSVNGKGPDAQNNVTIVSTDIATPDGTVQGDIEDLGANLASEISARASGDEALQSAVDGKQDALTSAQQAAVDSGITKDKVTSFSMTTQNLTRLGTRVDTIDDSVTAAQSDISQLKISDAEHTETLADQAKQLSSQATEITAIKAKDASQDSSISALQTKTTTHDTEIQGLSESVVSDLTGTFTDSTRTLKLSLERESAPSIDCSVVIPGGTGGGDVTSVNGKTGAVTIGASDVLSTAQLNAANSGITASKVTTYDGYSSSKQNTLSTAQLNAVNSGITSARVSTYDGYATGKADETTVKQIQTAVGGCFNDASITGNKLILGTVGGQQNTLTLPGGDGGGNLSITPLTWNELKGYMNSSTPRNPKYVLIEGYFNLSPVKQDIDGSFPTWNSSITNVNFINYGSLTNVSTFGFSSVRKSSNETYLKYNMSFMGDIGLIGTLLLPISSGAWEKCNTQGGISCIVDAYNAVENKTTSILININDVNYYKVE